MDSEIWKYALLSQPCFFYFYIISLSFSLFHLTFQGNLLFLTLSAHALDFSVVHLKVAQLSDGP